MPINPEIALSGKPVQFDPMEQYGKAMNLLAARQQMQMAPLKMEAAQLDLQNQRLANTNAQRDADEYTAFKEKVAAGAKPFELLSVAPKFASTHLKALAEQEKANLENLKTKTGLFSQALGSVKYAPPEQQPQQYQAVRADLLNKGVIKPEDAPEQFDPAFVDQHFRAAIDADKQVDDKAKELDLAQKVAEAAPKTAKEWRDLILQQASTARSQNELDQKRQTLQALGVPKALIAQTVPAMWSDTAMKDLTAQALTPEQREQNRLREMEVRKLNTPAELAAVASDPTKTPQERDTAKGALKILEQHSIASRPVMNVNATIPGMPTAPTQATGDDYLKTLPGGVAAQVKAIAEGRAALPSGSTRSQAAQQLRAAVFQYDPTYSDQRAQVRKAFTTGPDGKNIGALNTAIVHLGRLGDTAEALKNGSFTPGNELYNWARDKFGSPAVTNFGLLKDAVAGEMAAALKGTATDIEIEKMGKSIRAANSPEQMRGVIQEGMAVLNDKANTYDERYHAQNVDDPWSPILPSAKAQLQKHGVTKTGGGGAGKTVTTQAEYDALPAGATYVDASDGKTYTKKAKRR